MVRFLHAADIHLDSPLKGIEVHEDAPADEIRLAARRAFDNLVSVAIEESVDFVLIAGDLYDANWKDYHTGLFFVNRMGQLERAGIRVFLITGNHDATSQITKTMPLPKNVTTFSSKSAQSIQLEDLGIVIHGQSYATNAVTDNLAAHYPQRDPRYFNIGLLHTSLTGREGHERYAPCTIDDLKSKGYDYWALGHVHKREIVSEDPHIIFPGNIQGRHIKEAGAKGTTLVTVDDGAVTEIEHRHIDVLRWASCQVDLSDCQTADAVYEVVRSAMEKEGGEADGRTLALRLVLIGNTYMHSELYGRSVQYTEEFRGLATGQGMWLEKVQFRTKHKLNLEDIAGEDTPLAHLLESIDTLAFDVDTLQDLVPELTALKNKLPPEIYSSQESFLESSPEQIDTLLTHVKELLFSRLLQHGGDG